MSSKPTYKELEKRIQELEKAESLRKQSEAASKSKIEARMETIFKVSPIGIGVVADRILLEVNDCLCRMTGYQREELIGKCSRMLYPSDEDYEFVGRDKHRQIQEKGVGTVETRFISKGGEILIILLSSMPLDPGDLSVGVTFTALDITERKLAEDALRESEERLKIAGKASYDLIYEWTTANDALNWFGDIDGFLGYESGAVSRNIGAWLEMIHPEDRDQLKDAVEKHRTKAVPILYEYRIKHKDGTYRYIQDHGLPILDRQGLPRKWIGVCMNVTEFRRAELELKNKAIELEDVNTALNILLKKRDQENQETEQKIYSNYDLMITPFLYKLRNSLSETHQHQLLDILEASLKEILSPFIKKISDSLIRLTPSEIQIASMIKQGLSNKEIAKILNSSKRTIETHRANIRKKLNLKNKKFNLKSYFSTL